MADTATEEKKVVGRRVENATSATFDNDHKNAQYVRLVLFNYAVKQKMLKGDADINDSGINKTLEKAGLAILGGNLLEGKEGIEFIQSMTAKGSTTGRPLTTAFASEVRPWLRRLKASDKFGRRVSPEVLERKAEREKKAAEAKAKKEAEKAAKAEAEKEAAEK